jgi:asparagine synthase (glutamine-hydrolysing)
MRMLSAQRMYGPDAEAQWSNGNVAVGRRLMRLLPEDSVDRQPLVGAGGRYVLVADVRLDNRDELIKAVPIQQAAGLCDAAILLAAIERWDESCFEHIVGDYAFALWDSSRGRFLLARDPLGQRPLHYHRGDKFFAFASMPKGLHALPGAPYAPNEERIVEFLALVPETGTQSFFQGIERVEPGHVVAITAGALIPRRHWNPSRRQITFSRAEDYSDALRDLLNQAVRCRLRGIGDIGTQLSGGLDSSAVTATAARLLAPSTRKAIAFTAVPREGYACAAPSIVDEGPYAAATAALYPNIEHVLVRDEHRSPLDDLDRPFLFYDRPVLNPCANWVYSIFDAARKRKLSILLTGEMGNAGLSYTGMALLPELLQSGRWLRLLQEMRALVAPGTSWRSVLANTFGAFCPANLWRWLHRHFGNTHDLAYYSAVHPDHLAKLNARAKALKYDFSFRPPKDRFNDLLPMMSRVDWGNYNKGAIGGWQLDLRHPAADVRLLEFCLAVPTEQFLCHGVKRALAKRALADRLPEKVLGEWLKGLQGADWHERLTAERVTTELDLLDACSSATSALDLGRLRRLAESWPIGGWESSEIVVPYRFAMLRGIATGHFLRRATVHKPLAAL